MAYQSTDPVVVVEHTTVKPVVVERTKIVQSAWYSEPWGIALLLGVLVVLGLIAYFLGFNPPSTTSTVTTNTVTREVPASGSGRVSSAPIIVNNPPANSVPAVNPPGVINSSPVVAPATSNPSANSIKVDATDNTPPAEPKDDESPNSSAGNSDSSNNNGG